jgi:hypothetical protein
MSGSDTSAARATLIYNEQTKLLASALDRASTAVGVGAVFPLINVLNQVQGAKPGLFVGSFVTFGCASLMLHFIAQRALRGLRV